MDVIVKILGGYNSWQYTVVAIGLVIAGGGLTYWKAYFLPVAIMGQVMLIALINNQVLVDNIQGAAGGMASTITVVFAAICVLSDVKMLERHLPILREKEKTDEEKSPQEKPMETPDTFDKGQAKKHDHQ